MLTWENLMSTCDFFPTWRFEKIPCQHGAPFLDVNTHTQSKPLQYSSKSPSWGMFSGHKHGVTASAGQRSGDVEIRNYLRDQAGSRSLVFDLSIAHDRFGSSSHVQENGWVRRVSLETLIKNPLTSMTLVFRFCYMSSVRSTSDCRGPVTRKRVPDREEPGKPRKDARRGRCHPLEAGFWPLWMTPLPRNCSHKSQVTPMFNSS